MTKLPADCAAVTAVPGASAPSALACIGWIALDAAIIIGIMAHR